MNINSKINSDLKKLEKTLNDLLPDNKGIIRNMIISTWEIYGDTIMTLKKTNMKKYSKTFINYKNTLDLLKKITEYATKKDYKKILWALIELDVLLDNILHNIKFLKKNNMKLHTKIDKIIDKKKKRRKNNA